MNRDFAKAFCLVTAVLLFIFAEGAGIAYAGPTSPVQSWTQQTPATSPSAREAGGMAFDPATGNVVMFGGHDTGGQNDTWTSDGTDWTRQTPTTSPPARYRAAMAFDPANGNMVMFGGYGNVELNDTWTWDGTDWTKQTPTVSPSARQAAGMAFDHATGKIVLFGGEGSNGELSDTWTWNGTNWTKQTPTNSPSARHNPSMAFDQTTGKVLLFGGREPIDQMDDTWVWDGSNWSEKSPSTSPPARSHASMAFNPATGNMVLFGGIGSSGFLNDIWVWNGVDWMQQLPGSSPTGRYRAGMAFDPSTGSMLVFGGYKGGYTNETWTYGPPPNLKSNWTQRASDSNPSARIDASMTFDSSSGDVILFGGVDGSLKNDTWTWNGTQWSLLNPGTSPSPRAGSSMAFTQKTGNIVLFGGRETGSFSNDTWIWNGSSWTNKTPGTSPPVRHQASMAFDPATGDMVLFGGEDDNGPLNDTWTWNGINWTKQIPSTSPPPRLKASMAFDPATGNMVLFGGADDNGPLNDTWTWNGSDWTLRAISPNPPARSRAGMAFDPSIGRLVLFGGTGGGSNYRNDVQTWNGTQWSPRTSIKAPPARLAASMTFDPSSGNIVLFGGSGPANLFNDTWTYGLEADRPVATIASPTGSPSYPIGTTVPTAFSCQEGSGGPGISTCFDSNGASSPGALTTNSLGTKQYTVTAASWNGLVGENKISYVVTKTSPTVTTSGATSSQVGQTITVDATLAGTYQPTGTIKFTAYGPADPTCSGAPAFISNGSAISADGTYGAQNFTPTESGTYRWVTSYSGDTNNNAVSTACDATGSVSNVSKASPTVVPADATSAVVGETITADVDLTGGYDPEGTITFSAYGPDDATCTDTAAFTSSAVTVNGDGSYSSPDFTTSEAGTYRWGASYSGDAENEPATTTCDETGSVSTVGKASPMVTASGATSVEVGAEITVSTALADAYQPGGTIVFTAYGPDDMTCATSPIFTSSEVTVSGNDSYVSPAFSPSASGTYRWVASYSGDANNLPHATSCGDPGSVSTAEDKPEPPSCPALKLDFGLRSFELARPFGDGPKTPGLRVLFRTGSRAVAKISPRIRYRAGKVTGTARLKTRTIQVNGSRQVRFRLPSKVQRRLRNATGRLYRNRVTLKVTASLRLRGTPASCYQQARTRTLKTRVTSVSERAALRRRS